MPFDPPANLTNADEYRHSKPKGAEDLLYGDTLWVSVVLPDRHINVFGSYLENALEPEDKSIGGFVSDENGSRPLLNASAEISPNDGKAAMRAAKAFPMPSRCPTVR